MILKTKKYFLLAFIVLLSCTEELKIGKELSFFKLFGQNGKDAVYDIIQNENGYLAVGSTTSYGANNTLLATGVKMNAIIITVDNEGNQTNQTVFEQTRATKLQRVIGFNNNYVAIGTIANNNESDILVLFTDQNGNIKAQYTFGDSKFSELGVDLGFIDDDLFLLANQQIIDTVNQNILKSQILIIQIDQSGNEIWRRTYGIENKLSLGSALEVAKNQLVFTNYAFILSNQSVADLYLTTVTDRGNIVNSIVVSNNVLPFISPICVSTSNSAVHIAYSVAKTGADFRSFIAAFNQNTKILNREVNTTDNFLVTDLHSTPANNLAVLGIETNNAVAFLGRIETDNLLNNTLTNHIFKYDNFYNLLWSNKIGGKNQVGLALIEDRKAQYLIAGSALFGQTTMAMFIKTTQQGRLTK